MTDAARKLAPPASRFDEIGERVRLAVRAAILIEVNQNSDVESVQAASLGALAGAIEAWATFTDPSMGADDLAVNLQPAVRDLCHQARENIRRLQH